MRMLLVSMFRDKSNNTKTLFCFTNKHVFIWNEGKTKIRSHTPQMHNFDCTVRKRERERKETYTQQKQMLYWRASTKRKLVLGIYGCAGSGGTSACYSGAFWWCSLLPLLFSNKTVFCLPAFVNYFKTKFIQLFIHVTHLSRTN